MNKRIKKKRRSHFYVKKKIRDKNKELCKRYPFLIIRDWRGLPLRNKSYNIIWDFGPGWTKAFGGLLCEDMRNELLRFNYLKQFRLYDVKEKYGELRVYTNGTPIGCEVDHIIDDYSILSRNICYDCGKPDVSVTNSGWILPICKECFYETEKRKNRHRTEKLSDSDIEKLYEKCVISEPKLEDSWILTSYKNGEKNKIERDISGIAEKIRKKYYERNKCQ